MKTFLILLIVATIFSSCLPSGKCENVADIVYQATLFLCQSTGDTSRSVMQTDGLANQLITLLSTSSDPRARDLIAQLEDTKRERRRY